METPLSITVTRFTHDGMLVKSILVPLVLTCAVPDVIALAPITNGLPSVLLVSVWVALSVTTFPVLAGNVAVKSLAVLGVVSVTEPPPDEFSLTGILCHRPRGTRGDGYGRAAGNRNGSECAGVLAAGD